MVVALKPLHDVARIKRVVVSTYQASSGKGAKGLFELDAQLSALGRGVSRGKGRPALPLLTEVPKSDDAPFAHPSYWAAFVLYGDPD